MEVHSWEDLEKALKETREEFRKTTAPIKSLLDRAVSLFFESVDLIRTVAKDGDDEKYALELLATTFRRIVSSIVLLESGFPQEAHMVLRNAWEWQLIAIDIAYNRASLQEWEKTTKEDLEDYDEWYFKTSKVYKRISNNEENVYPELERKLAENTYEDWKRISNKSLHAHSQVQIRSLFDERGNFQLMGRKTIEHYKENYRLYQSIIFNIVSLLFGISKYRDLIGKNPILKERRDRFAANYANLQKEMSDRHLLTE